MERIFDGKYHYNADMYAWERADREQYYRGIRIVSVTSYLDGRPHNHHRFYELTWPNGKQAIFGINKRGGNITEIKEWIDFKYKYNEF